MQYYEINEQTARRANNVNSMSDYHPGSATEEYRAAVDKAAALVQARKAKISPTITARWTPCLTATPAALPTTTTPITATNRPAPPSSFAAAATSGTQQKQNARRDSLWQEYKDIDAILDKIRSVGTGAVDLTDPTPANYSKTACSRNKTPLIIARPPMPTTASTKPCAAMPA